LPKYEEETLRISGIELGDWLEIKIAPYLKEVSTVSFQLSKSLYIQYEKEILDFMDEYSKRKCVMMGHGHYGYNKYKETGYGHMDIGVYWTTWLCKWTTKYLDKEEIDILSNCACEVADNQSYFKVKISKNPWDLENIEIEKKQRKLMKSLKFHKFVLKYNKNREFSYA